MPFLMVVWLLAKGNWKSILSSKAGGVVVLVWGVVVAAAALLLPRGNLLLGVSPMHSKCGLGNGDACGGDSGSGIGLSAAGLGVLVALSSKSARRKYFSTSVKEP